MKFENLIELIGAVSESALTDFTYEENDVKVQLSKKQPDIYMNAPESEFVQNNNVNEADNAINSGKIVISPLVGTFYAAPNEEADAFVKLGDNVTVGQTLAIVEAMKLMNEIESEYDGEIAEILVSNGEMVEYGQPLFRLK